VADRWVTVIGRTLGNPNDSPGQRIHIEQAEIRSALQATREDDTRSTRCDGVPGMLKGIEGEVRVSGDQRARRSSQTK
jgi:hypothetical protein